VAAVEQSVLAALELVGDERGDEIDGRQFLGLRLAQARVEDGGHTGEAELPQGAIEFDEIHEGVSRTSGRCGSNCGTSRSIGRSATPF
jgi:hypothetical protein